MENKSYFENEYMPKMHRIGKLIGFLGVVVSFLPPLVLALVFGLYPKLSALLTAFISALTAFGILWIIEPISYFSVLGPVGTYMAFLSGNISNMRVPCASMAQIAAGEEPGTEKGSIIATIGMAVSVIINIAVLTLGIFLGISILSMVPPKVKESLIYLLPALFGALFVQFGIKSKSTTTLMLVFALMMNVAVMSGLFAWLPGASGFVVILSCVFVSIGVTMRKLKASEKKQEQ